MNEKTVGMLIGKKNVYEYLELSNAVYPDLPAEHSLSLHPGSMPSYT